MKHIYLAIMLISIIVAIVSFTVFLVTPDRCYEDQSCWNCHTMGNKECGS